MGKDIDQLVDEIVFLMTGREKSIFANMDKKDLPYVRYAFDGWLAGKIDNDKHADEMIHKIWLKLGQSYRLRRVK